MGKHGGGSATRQSKANTAAGAAQGSARLGSATALQKQQSKLDRLLDPESQRETDQTTRDRAARALADRLRSDPAFQRLARRLNRDTVYRSIAHVKNPEERAVQRLMWIWSTAVTNRQANLMMHVAVEQEFGLAGHHSLNSERAQQAMRSWGKQLDGLRAFARAQYEHTQEWLKANNITSVTLWRGMNWTHGEEPQARQWDNRVHNSTLRLQPIASFSASMHIATLFGGPGSGPHNHMELSATRVPSSRIFATAQTGLGDKHESEFLVLGGRWNARVRSAETRSMAAGDALFEEWRLPQTYRDFASA